MHNIGWRSGIKKAMKLSKGSQIGMKGSNIPKDSRALEQQSEIITSKRTTEFEKLESTKYNNIKQDFQDAQKKERTHEL